MQRAADERKETRGASKSLREGSLLLPAVRAGKGGSAFFGVGSAILSRICRSTWRSAACRARTRAEGCVGECGAV